MSIGVIYDDLFLEHITGDHPEKSARLTAITQHLKALGIWQRLEQIPFEPATPAQMLRVHSGEHLQHVRELAESGGGMADRDTVVSPLSYRAALTAAGGLVKAVETVVSGRVEGVFALVRPPGHHASLDKSMGFCLFNNIAVGAAHALESLGVERILILDWDVHRGNGTQSVFRHEPRVRYISLHQHPLYPGPLAAGDSKNEDFDIPLPPGCGQAEYLRVMDEIVTPAARLFRPQLIMVSAGYDAHWMDFISGMRLSADAYAAMTGRVQALARELCAGRMVFSLEGGYDLAALPASVAATLSVLLDTPVAPDELGSGWGDGPPPDISSLLTTLRAQHNLS